MHVERLKAEEEQIASGDNILNKTKNTEDDDDDDDMESQLNPDAKEFVPTSPVRSTPLSPLNNGGGLLQVLNNDRILAQSPRKNGSTPMDIIDMPSEDDFINDIEKRPADVDDGTNLDSSFTEFKRPASSSSTNSYEELNSKEAMQVDEKIQEYGMSELIMPATPSAPPSEDIGSPIGESNAEPANAALMNGGAATLSDIGNANYIDLLTQSHREQDPMGVSFYDDGTNATVNPFEAIDLNAVHLLPGDQESDFESDKENNPNFVQKDENLILNGVETCDLVSPQQDVHDEISKPEDDQYTPVSETKAFDDMLQSNNTQSYHVNESDVPESELMITNAEAHVEADAVDHMISGLNVLTLSDATLSPQYEAEHFVENIKEAQSGDKYTESGLSPNAEEFRPFGVSEMATMNGDEFVVSDQSFSDIKESPIEDSAESDLCLSDNVNQMVILDEQNDLVAKTPETMAADEKDEDLDLIDEAAESDVCMHSEPQLMSLPEASQPDLIVIPSEGGADEIEISLNDRQFAVDAPSPIESQQVDKMDIATEDVVPLTTESVPTIETVATSQEVPVIPESAPEVTEPEPITVEPVETSDVASEKPIVDDVTIPEVSADDAAKAAAAAAVAAAAALIVVAAKKKTAVSQSKTAAKKSDTIKPTKAPVTTVPAKKTTSTTSAPKSAPVKAPVKATSLTTATAKVPPPIARPRTVVSATSTKAVAIEKKSVTSTTSATATTAKKPIANGEVKSSQSVLNSRKTSLESKSSSATAALSATKSSTTTVTKTTTARSTLITKSAPSKPTTILVTRTAATTRFVWIGVYV